MLSAPVWLTRDGRATASRAGNAVSVGDFLEGLAGDRSFRSSFTELLRAVPYLGFCWEMPPLVPAKLGDAFECALVDSPLLASAIADPEPFREHFDDADVVSFESLGRDALLVAPTPRGPIAAYAHLGAFVREGPPEQVDALWRHVAAAVRGRIGERPLWLSTAGLGVSWLHVRLDSRPKYYRTAAYRG